MFVMPRKGLDIGWKDLIHGLALVGSRVHPPTFENRINALWPGNRHLLACLSVRSGFDLVLKALAWPAGSQILVSAVTIPDMVAIIKAHGLEPVPVDMDMDRLEIKLADAVAKIGPRTRAILTAHLFGSRMPMDAIVALARERGLLVMEDCAQGFRGDGWGGHQESDVAFFSFGPIKTATALGGAVVTIGCHDLWQKARRWHQRYPVQPRGVFLYRVLKYGLWKALLRPPGYGALAALCRGCGVSLDELVREAGRGFARQHFWSRIRQRPSVPLLGLMARRLGRPDTGSVRARVRLARQLAGLMPRVARPGAGARDHSHWLLPVLSRRPEALVARLQLAGFDATRGSTSLVAVKARGYEAEEAAAVMADIVYLPVYEDIPPAAVATLAALVNALASGDDP